MSTVLDKEFLLEELQFKINAVMKKLFKEHGTSHLEIVGWCRGVDAVMNSIREM